MPKQFNGKYEYDTNGVDEIISERGDNFLALREVRWFSDKPFKLDLRNYRSSEEGDTPLKGCAITDDDADELVNILIKEGFGDNDNLVDTITSYRPDLCRKLKDTFKEGAGMSQYDSRVKLFERRQRDDELSCDQSGDGYFDPSKILED